MSSPVGTTVGASHVTDGSTQDFRLGKDRQLIIDGLHGAQYEACSRGTLFSATQAATGVAPGTAFSTTAPLQLWNPPNSGVNLVVREVAVGYVSGTLGAGCIGYGIQPSQVTLPTTGTAITTVAMNGTFATNSAAKANTGSTLSAAATLAKLGPSIVATLATAASAAIGVYYPPSKDVIDGGIIVPQGAAFTVQSYFAAAGTSPVTVMSVVWEEVTAVAN